MNRHWLEFLYWGGLALVLSSIVIWALVRRNRKRLGLVEAWREFAARFGFAFSLDSLGRWPVLEGRYEGVPVRMRIAKHGTDHPTYYGYYEADFERPLPGGTTIRGRAYYPPLRNKIKTGDPEVDKLLQVEVADLDEFKRLLSIPKVREALLAFFRESGKTMRGVTPQGANIHGQPEESDPTVLLVRVRTLVDFVKTVDEARG